MATQQKVLFRGDVPTTNSSVYSVPSGTSAIATSLVVSNSNIDPITVNLSIAAVKVLTSVEVLGNDAVFIDFKQVLNEFDAIETSASTTGVTLHISGVEIS